MIESAREVAVRALLVHADDLDGDERLRVLDAADTLAGLAADDVLVTLLDAAAPIGAPRPFPSDLSLRAAAADAASVHARLALVAAVEAAEAVIAEVGE
jgi:hypothetical protein